MKHVFAWWLLFFWLCFFLNLSGLHWFSSLWTSCLRRLFIRCVRVLFFNSHSSTFLRWLIKSRIFNRKIILLSHIWRIKRPLLLFQSLLSLVYWTKVTSSLWNLLRIHDWINVLINTTTFFFFLHRPSSNFWNMTEIDFLLLI